jgi:hypothetical protein
MSLIEEITAGPLAAEITPYIASGDDAAIADTLNRRDIPAKKSVSAHDIRKYMMLNDLLLQIELSTEFPCIATKRALEVFETFDLSDALVLSKFTGMLDALMTTSTGFATTHKAALLELGDTLVSRADLLGLTVTPTDVAQALRP